jgi:hypothetical protein
MVEYKLYYDDTGNVICYTCDLAEGKFIVIDRQTFAEGRHDVKVIDGRIVRISDTHVITKLVPSKGTMCAAEDINVIVDETYNGPTQEWKIKTYEFKYN